jgi:hypothetical protein
MSERAVATTDVDRFAKLIRLIFSTDQEGEAAAAVDAVKRMLASENVDAHWLADSFKRGAAPLARVDDVRADRHGDDEERDDHSAIWFCWHRRHRLSPREHAFIERIRTWRGPLSEKQQQWLYSIVDRLDAG